MTNTKKPLSKITGYLECHIFFHMVWESGREMCPSAHLEVPLIEQEVTYNEEEGDAIGWISGNPNV
jgi:hypothetical protein